MLFITYSAQRVTRSVRVKLIESKTSHFTGNELVIGIEKNPTPRKWMLVARQVIVMAKQHRIKKIAIDLADFKMPAEAFAVNFEMANYEFVEHRTKPEEGWSFVEEVAIAGADKKAQSAIARGQIIGEEINKSRSLANSPPGHMTPASLAKSAKAAAAGTSIKVKILGRTDMQKLGMGAILGVAQGSVEEPKFIVMEYGSREGAIVLVGKGVTFDSGGLNLKPDKSLYEMHMDMSGGAAVIHAIVAYAKLGIPARPNGRSGRKKNIVGLIPAVENMPSGSSYRPGDVLKTMSGKTIEVLNTDAEGRVILADALTYAERYKPKLVIDVATLTGAAEAALGRRASAIFSKDDNLIAQVQKLGEISGDYVWPLPLWDEYEDDIKGTFGDWANVGKPDRHGGAITGAMFLYQFAKSFPWLHIDMAPRMTAIEGEFLAKGSAGAPVRLLVKLLDEF